MRGRCTVMEVGGACSGCDCSVCRRSRRLCGSRAVSAANCQPARPGPARALPALPITNSHLPHLVSQPLHHLVLEALDLPASQLGPVVAVEDVEVDRDVPDALDGAGPRVLDRQLQRRQVFLRAAGQRCCSIRYNAN